MTDNITLPREVVQEALEALELEATSPPLETTAAAMAALRAYLPAPTVKESLTHPGYIIGSHWLETAYSRVCAGEAEADVLRDCGWRRCAVGQGLTQHCAEAEALRRDAERLRTASEKLFRKWSNAAPYHQWEPEMFEMELALYPPKQENKT